MSKRIMPKHAEAARKDYTLQVRCNDAFLDALDDWRRAQDDLPSRAEAIRRIVAAEINKTMREGRQR